MCEPEPDGRDSGGFGALVFVLVGIPVIALTLAWFVSGVIPASWAPGEAEGEAVRCAELQAQFTAMGTGLDGSSFGDAFLLGEEANSLGCSLR